ncbi:hypothetical protein WICMUC_003169 [Wickerhamomyces mucosus]|uniref:Cdc23 domain-containing protein n=1 Tax=Wickerhamomyces mucosus TaxID=1378264 RepID=A0A9P8PLT5_9ASCO|nr:hypothetical protein WICMUC_003169 [Wickerhamomyces mucosus]
MNQSLELDHLKFQLREATELLGSLGLYQGSKWCAEALNGIISNDLSKNLSSDKKSDSDETLSIYDLEDNEYDNNETTPVNDPLYNVIFKFPKVQSKINDKYQFAKSLFDCKEFDRCSQTLNGLKSSKCIFLRLYSKFLSHEKKKEEETEGVLGQNDNYNSTNPSIPLILKELDQLFDENNNHKFENYSENPFLLYLKGILLLRQKFNSLAQQTLIKSLKIYPFNWSCWVELISSLNNLDQSLQILKDFESFFEIKFLNKSNFNNNQIHPIQIIVKIVKIVINQEFFQQSMELYDDLNYLLQIFPNFSYLKTQKALISYHSMDYQEAEDLFDDILTNDPLRLDDMDIYSNILYVMEKKSKLSYLAQFASSIDRFRSETCCIVANYYSLKFEHEKAIMYYRRALTLNRNCLSAWTLMGHEFVELKNSHAAIESYRRAVDTNIKDFKAWYGLGQAYEVLDMHLYSLYYYQRACTLKPLDKRIWQALGNCYEKLNKFKDSIKSYKKVLNLNEVENFDNSSIFFKLALLYEKLLNSDKVYEFMKLCYNEEINLNVKNDETAKARLWLSKFEIKNKNFELAYNYASDFNHGTSQEIEEARSIAREARNRINSKLPNL